VKPIGRPAAVASLRPARAVARSSGGAFGAPAESSDAAVAATRVARILQFVAENGVGAPAACAASEGFLNSYDEEAAGDEYVACSAAATMVDEEEGEAPPSFSGAALLAAIDIPAAAAGPSTAARPRRARRYASLSRAQFMAQRRDSGAQQPSVALGDLEAIPAWLAPPATRYESILRFAEQNSLDGGALVAAAAGHHQAVAAAARDAAARQHWLLLSYCEEAMGSFDETAALSGAAGAGRAFTRRR